VLVKVKAVPAIKYYVMKMYSYEEASSFGLWEDAEMRTGQEAGSRYGRAERNPSLC
jgi:hypothetical protein